MTVRSAAMVLWLVVAAAGCTGPPVGTRLHVSAAASLADAFADVAAAFEDEHDDVEVALNLAGSATLVEQLLGGAPVDVLATADPRTMQRAVDAGVAADPVPFATNMLVVAHPADGPARDVADLADRSLLVGLCAPQVPCGAAAKQALAALGVTARPDTEDSDVRTLLARLERGELDVGVVYATDLATAADEVRGAVLPDSETHLVIATTPQAAPVVADEFVQFVRSPTGASILAEHGFGVVEPDQ